MTSDKSQRTAGEPDPGDPMAAYADETPEQRAEHERQIAEQAALEQRTVVPPVHVSQVPDAPPPPEGETQAQRTERESRTRK